MRQKNIRTFLALIVIISVVANIAEAGSKKRRGTAGAQELLIPVGSRGTAMSGAYVAGISGLEAIEWNMAGLSGMSNNGQAMSSYSSWIADIGVTSAAIAYSFGGNSVFGVSLKSLDFGNIPVTTALLPDGTGETYSPSYMTIGFLFSRKMTDRIFFGSTVKLVSESIMREAARGVVIDAGVQYKADNGFSLGASLKNLGLNMIFSGADLEEFHTPEDAEPGTNTEPRRIFLQEFEMPTTLELGISYDVNLGPSTATFAVSFLNNNFSFDEYRFGAEFLVMDMLSLRGGLSMGYDPEPYGVDGLENTADDEDDESGLESGSEEFIWGPTLGFGLDLAKLTGLGLSVDYAYRTAKFFDGVSWLTLTVAF